MAYNDLGLAADNIATIVRTAGTGEAGSLDTYTITTASGDTFQFQVRNGTNGASGIVCRDFTSWASLNTWLQQYAKYALAMFYIRTNASSSVEAPLVNTMDWWFNQLQNTYELTYKTTGADTVLADSNTTPTLSATNFVRVYVFDDTPASLDTSLDIDSTNAITNRAITGSLAKPAGVYDTLAALTAAYPSGNSNVYVVRADNKWYTWSGSAWVAGGDYKGDINVVPTSRTIAGLSLEEDINAEELAESLDSKVKDTFGGYMLKDNSVAGNKIDPEKLFTEQIILTSEIAYTDGRFVKPDGSTAGAGIFSIAELSNIGGYKYLYFTSFNTTIYDGSNPANLCCFFDDNNNVIQASDYYPSIIVLDENTKLLEVKVPQGASKFWFNIYLANKSSTIAKGDIYNSKKKLEWATIDIDPSDIEQSFISKGEQLTPTINDGFYRTEGEFAIAVNSNASFKDISFPIKEGKRYILEFAVSIDESTYKSFFIFASGTLPNGEAGTGYMVIQVAQIPNYVKHLGGARYEIIAPVNAKRIYTTAVSENVSAVKMYEAVEFSFDWLKLKQVNFDNETIPFKSLKRNWGTYKYGDSLNKPFSFQGKALVAFGDSITYGVTSDGGNAGSRKYVNLFASKFSMTLDNQAVNGSTITYGVHESIVAISTKVTSYNFANSSNEVIFVAGGTNDYGSSAPLGQFGDTTNTTFYGALDVICQYLQTNAPNSLVIFITPIYPNRLPLNEIGLTLADYQNAIWEVATKYGFNVVDGSKFGFAEEENTPWGNFMIGAQDGIHPSIAGHRLYFIALCNKLC